MAIIEGSIDGNVLRASPPMSGACGWKDVWPPRRCSQRPLEGTPLPRLGRGSEHHFHRDDAFRGILIVVESNGMEAGCCDSEWSLPQDLPVTVTRPQVNGLAVQIVHGGIPVFHGGKGNECPRSSFLRLPNLGMESKMQIAKGECTREGEGVKGRSHLGEPSTLDDY